MAVTPEPGRTAEGSPIYGMPILEAYKAKTIIVNKRSMPSVITADLRLNEPRYVTLPNIMKAKKKPLEAVNPDVRGVDVAPRLKTVKVSAPAARKAGIKVSSQLTQSANV